ncbi:MAG: MATE family efflux transporter [Erysipelotrichaceae bacterium]|nr:MATE family efflux transporter [Erysipelotrichaceae bacterium]
MASKNSIDMVNGPLVKNIFIYSLPLMATNFLQMVFTAADTIVVGAFAGNEALAAVGATGSLIFLLTSLFTGLSTGTNVVIANSIGSGDRDRVHKSVHSSVWMGLVCGLGLSVAGVLIARFCLTLMSTPAEIIDGSTTYMRIYFTGSLFVVLYNFGGAILRSKGDTKRPLYFLMFSGVINVILNLIFVIVFQWSVVGVALATVISQMISCILVYRALLTDDDDTRLILKDICLDVDIVKEILRIGIPAGIQGMAFSVSNVVIQSSINSFDSSLIVAGNAAAANIENFVYVGMMAFASAAMTFTSQNIGAKNYGSVKRIMWVTMILDCFSALSVGFLAWYFGRFFLSFYTSDPSVIEYGIERLFWVAMFLALNGVLDVFINSLRGMGNSTVPTLIMIVGIVGIRLAWLWLYFPTHRQLGVIYMCFPISWVITSLLLGGLWLKEYKKLMAGVL